MSFTDRKPFIVNEAMLNIYRRTDQIDTFGCLLCGHFFKEGDTARWIFANCEISSFNYGNFFVCDKCDGSDEEVLRKAEDAAKNINLILARRVG